MKELLNQYVRELQEGTVVSEDVMIKARQRLTKENRWYYFSTAFRFAAVPMTVVVLVFAFWLTKNNNNNNSVLPIPFLQAAQAAYQDMSSAAANVGATVRHEIVEMTQTGIIQGAEKHSTESWQTSDGQRLFSITNTNNPKYSYLPNSSATINGMLYLPKKFIDSISPPPDDGQSHFYVADDISATSGSSPRYSLEMPNDVNAINQSLDPVDSTIECFDFSEKSAEQVKLENFLSELKTAAGFDTNQVPDTGKTIDLLSEGMTAGYIQDLGVSNDADGAEQHWFQATNRYSIFPDGDPTQAPGTSTFAQTENNSVKFGFSPDTYKLTTIIFIFDFGDGSTDSAVKTTYKILTDEFITVDQANPALMDPEGQGLVVVPPVPGHPENLPSFKIEEGCYKQGIEAPTRLSPEEEAAVRERIKNIVPGM